jgi:hypothetical protein
MPTAFLRFKRSFANFSTSTSNSFGGEYRELVPNERICSSDKFDDPNLPGEMLTTVQMCYLGWQEFLAQLATLVEQVIHD